MHFEVLVGAVAKDLRAAKPEVGEPGDVLLGRQSGRLVKMTDTILLSSHFEFWFVFRLIRWGPRLIFLRDYRTKSSNGCK
jgi:hypothetical protein